MTEPGMPSLLVQGFFVLFNAGAVAGVAGMLIKHLIELAYQRYKASLEEKEQSRRRQEYEKQETIKKATELEELKQKNMQTSIDANSAMVKVLNTALARATQDIENLVRSNRHLDEQLAVMASYMPYFEKFKQRLDAERSNPSIKPDKFPEQEHIRKGDTLTIRDKKPPKKE
jgi:hypothetical protein